MRSGVIVVEDNTSSIGQFWAFAGDGRLQFVELRTVFFRVDGLARRQQLIVDNTFVIPPNTQQNLFWVEASFGDRSRTFVSL